MNHVNILIVIINYFVHNYCAAFRFRFLRVLVEKRLVKKNHVLLG
jgi:hypothetical protein